MTSLDQLEHRLRPQLQRALTEVMPHLERQAGPGAVWPDSGGTDEPVHLLAPSPDRTNGGRWALTLAAGMLAVVGGLWWLSAGRSDTPRSPADGPSVATQPNSTPSSTQALSSTSSVPEVSLYPLDQLDPLSAAREITLAARIEPTPDEYADLAVAGEALRRDCMRDGGATPPAITSAEHVATRDQRIATLRQRTRLYTTEGLAALRISGYFPDDIDSPVGSGADPLFLPVTEGSLEAQLLADGCGWVDEPLRPGPVERALSELRATEVDGDATGSRWADMALAPQMLPEYADEFAPLRDCMAAAGYPSFWDFDAEPNPFAEFMAEPGVSEAELATANAHADCSIALDVPTTYVETVGAVLDDFDRAHRSDLAALRSERDAALVLARTILAEHGLDPFTA